MKFLYFSIVLLLFCVACNKKIDVKAVDFDVSTDSAAYQAGDTVYFHFSGNPGIISFFSGEPGSKYTNRNRDSASGNISANFYTSRLYGNSTKALSFLVSNDFNGIYDSTNLSNATWTDISYRAIFGTTSTNTFSGNVSLNDFVNPSQPLFLAFRYIGLVGPTIVQSRWNVASFKVTNTLPDSTSYNIADILSASWTAVSITSDPLDQKWNIGSSSLVILSSTVANEQWVVTAPLQCNSVIPDNGVTIKGIDSKVSTFPYVFSKPGTYNIAFVGINANVYGQNSVVKQLTLTIY
ncbi:DUF5017 domain-containing protein [Parasediminibacterium sp. JCM 36343]|uniref:DUF5017 domain-containing protein n=1 Tax=Parasediminibacterium sp. JCM 36343 TaxID=3374279 RepID=UPI00397A2954